MSKQKYFISDWINKRSGHLIIKKDLGSRLYGGKSRSFVLCICDCGNRKELMFEVVCKGKYKSCGCMMFQDKIKHGMYNTREYNCHKSMMDRCYNKNNKRYKDYGGRGIIVCSRWRRDFLSFYKDMGPVPSINHSLDRIDVNKGYNKNNCRWATDYEQRSNKQNTVKYTFNGVTKHLSEWARFFGVNTSGLSRVIKNRNGEFSLAYNYYKNKGKC